MRIEECETCGDVTEHLIESGIVFCSNCLAHWRPKRKASSLYTCEECGVRVLVFKQGDQLVRRPVKPCFRPDPAVVECYTFLCSSCIPADVPVST